MDSFQAIVLALVQGLTEFLPISSSAHLILVPVIFDWPDQGVAFDVAVHVGTLIAVLAYFRQEVWQLLYQWFASGFSRHQTQDSRLAWWIILATIPVGLVGLLLKDQIGLYLRGELVIAWATIGFGLLLGLASDLNKAKYNEYQLNWQMALAIGGAQALALIPGTSRSGITITMGLLLGLSPQAAARFSFLLSMPIIVLAGGLVSLDLLQQAKPVHWNLFALGVGISAMSAYLSIHYFLKLLNNIGMMPFVIYRLLLGVVLFVLFC